MDNSHLDPAELSFFCEKLRECLDRQLESLIIYGSAVFDDLAPGYGDLDFLAVLRDDLDEETCSRLVTLRRPFRDGSHGVYGQMLEGAFLPRRMLDPTVPGKALWWGTSGERSWEISRLGWFALEVIRRHGTIIWGEDCRSEIPLPSEADLRAEIMVSRDTVRLHGQGGTLHSIDWLLTAARMLLWLKEERFGSKSAAADWAILHAAGDWRLLLPQAKELRMNPLQSSSPEVQEWLNRLTPTIQQAWDEVVASL